MRGDNVCKGLDNHGDLGVCWRLARDLATRGHNVRLWVDDAAALHWMRVVNSRPSPSRIASSSPLQASATTRTDGLGCIDRGPSRWAHPLRRCSGPSIRPDEASGHSGCTVFGLGTPASRWVPTEYGLHRVRVLSLAPYRSFDSPAPTPYPLLQKATPRRPGPVWAPMTGENSLT